MAKRQYTPLNIKTVSKKQRLDNGFYISVQTQAQAKVSVQSSSNDLWGNDEDEEDEEVIAAITQVESKELPRIYNEWKQSETHICSSNQFPSNSNSQACSSTSSESSNGIGAVQYTSNTIAENKSPAEEGSPDAKNNVTLSAPAGPFKIPAAKMAEKQYPERFFIAKETQITYLQTQLQNQKKLNQQLTKNLNESKDKMNLMEGQISTLQYKIRSLQSINEKLRTDKLQEAATVSNDLNEKIIELENTTRQLRFELDEKVIELRKQRFGKHSSPKEATPNCKAAEKIDPFRTDRVVVVVPKKHEIANEIFELSQTSNHESGLLEQHLDVAQKIFARQEVGGLLNNSELIDKLFNSSIEALLALINYTKEFKVVRYANSKVGAEHERLALIKSQGKNIPLDVSIYGNRPMFPNEIMPTGRRLFAIIALACDWKPFRDLLLTRSYKLNDGRNYKFFNHLIEMTTYILNSDQIYEHLGLLTAVSDILSHLGPRLIEYQHTQDVERDILRLFNRLVFCRVDNIHPLSKLCHFLSTISTSDPRTMNIVRNLCRRKESLELNKHVKHKMLQVNGKMCQLEVFAHLLEVALPRSRTMKLFEYTLLEKCLFDLTSFLECAIRHDVDWVKLSNTTSESCRCFNALIDAFIVLWSQYLEFWKQSFMEIDDPFSYRKLNKLVIILFSKVFANGKTRYVLSRKSIKNRLQTCWNMMDLYANELGLKDPQRNILQKIKTACVMRDASLPHDDKDKHPIQSTNNDIVEMLRVSFID